MAQLVSFISSSNLLVHFLDYKLLIDLVSAVSVDLDGAR